MRIIKILNSFIGQSAFPCQEEREKEREYDSALVLESSDGV